MAEAKTDAPKKARKPQGPRQERPTFVLVSYTDEHGNPQKLDADRLNLSFTKDASQLVKMFTSGDTSNTIVKEVRIGAERPSPAASDAPAAE
jgi:hypothetical protein